jgi:hypothetical protein
MPIDRIWASLNSDAARTIRVLDPGMAFQAYLMVFCM